jgi:hypothetical protein
MMEKVKARVKETLSPVKATPRVKALAVARVKKKKITLVRVKALVRVRAKKRVKALVLVPVKVSPKKVKAPVLVKVSPKNSMTTLVGVRLITPPMRLQSNG